jgi:hypothetical protein
VSAASKYLKLKPRERKISPTTRKPLPTPDLSIEVFDVRVFEGGRNKGTIVCKQMKCEFPSGDLATDVGKLAQEWLDLKEINL